MHFKGLNYVELNFMSMLGTPEAFDVRPDREYGLKLIKYLADNKVYISIVGGGDRLSIPFGDETCAEMKKVAGEYYMARNLAEGGSVCHVRVQVMQMNRPSPERICRKQKTIL